MPTNKQILNNLYGLMLEINYQQDDKDVLAELEAKPDSVVNNHLLKIKQLTAKLKAEANRQRYADAVSQLQLLKQKGIEEFKKLFSPSDQTKLVPMFNRFTELSQKDEQEILEDQEMLHFMEILKDRANETDSNNG
ncbi:hypothetical protein LLH06_10440 [Mucilaginibacter daejeonensis]|uniref:hypothetical protein n=1 Tax=Mucilaginibacter daejeonensis TaxID=398049 RepID=UPI001D17B1D5|nr:hypothetical protein [Mucilaginibacter daejeonensis]UEG51390.1 hypothetical protein LLH06_10440 [Mucilaginibacter daejeonensis]